VYVSLHSILGVEESSHSVVIQNAYKKLVREWNPAKNLHRMNEATVRFRDIHDAYAILGDTELRPWYNSGWIKAAQVDDSKVGVDLWRYFNTFREDTDFFPSFDKLFSDIWELELLEMKTQVAAPHFGSSTGAWKEVVEFYQFWENFVSCRSFSYHRNCSENDEEKDEFDFEAAIDPRGLADGTSLRLV
jgi:DnaJ-class molecular chaperone